MGIKVLALRALVCGALLVSSATVFAAEAETGAEGATQIDWHAWRAEVDVANHGSLQRGARNFVSYCLPCHSLKYERYSRLGQDLASRFVRECDILATLEHPNIVRLYDAGATAQGLRYLAMEYVDGEPLVCWCDRRHLGVQDRLTLFLQVLDAVQYAHGQQVIHRDIKPSNILVTQDGQVRLLDFGAAKLLEREELTGLTRLYGRALTPEYASPELLRGDAVSATSDVYALGIVLYELLAGNHPRAVEAGAPKRCRKHAIPPVKKPSTRVGPDAAAARATTQDQLVRRLKGDLDAIVLKALAGQPEDRYGSATAFADDLRRYLSGEPVVARADRALHRLAKVALSWGRVRPFAEAGPGSACDGRDENHKYPS